MAIERPKPAPTKSLIEPGMVIKNHEGYEVNIETVERGQFGLFLRGVFRESGAQFGGYTPWELPPIERQDYHWHGMARATITLLHNSHNIKVGILSLYQRARHTWNIEAYETKWEETIEAMRKEEQDGYSNNSM